MSVADGMPPAIMLPPDPDFRASRDREAGSAYLRRSAIALAALAHGLVIAAMIVHWPDLFAVKPLERPPIPVTLVTEMPPPPAPPAKPTPPPPPAPPQLQHELVSGADTKTTAPPQAADKGEEAAPKPTPPPPVDAQAKDAAPEVKPTPPQETRQEKPKIAKRETAPKRERNSVLANRAPGETEREGDPYLNHMRLLVEQHRFYPANAKGSLGLPLQGIGTYLVAIAADGTLKGMEVERSAGAEVLDQVALKMIQAAAPFPPLPAYYPRPQVVIEVTIPIFPTSG